MGARTHGARYAQVAATVVLGLCGVAVLILLLPSHSADFRSAVISVALVGGGLAAAICCAIRARALQDSRRRPWVRFAMAGCVAAAGNTWAGLTGSPADNPDVVTTLSIAVALLLSIAGLLSFVTFHDQVRDRFVMVIDGIVLVGALTIIGSALIFPDLIIASPDRSPVSEVATLAFPMTDFMLASLAVLVLVRVPRSKQLPLSLVAVGFSTYAVSDIAYSLGVAHGDYSFGTPWDLGWVTGYLLIAAAALTPVRALDEAPPEPGLLTTVVGGVVLFLTISAVIVQAVVIAEGDLSVISSVALVLMMLAAGARRILLSLDYKSLRNGLEQRVRAQTQDLQSMVRRQDALLTSVGEGIYGVDSQGRITFVNPTAARILGYPADELTGARAHDVFHVPELGESDHGWTECSVNRAVVDGLESTLQGHYRTTDGTVIPVESTAAPLVDDTGRRGAVVVFREISQRREVERMKNEFLSVVSHELRTPLTAILGSLDMVASGEFGELPAPVVELVGVASRSSERLSRLINDLLDFERIESGTEPMHLATTPASSLIVSAIQQVKGMADLLGVTVVTGALAGTVTVDEDQIVQTLINLISNALKFSPTGGEVIVESRQFGTQVHFDVHDRGRGIPADKLESVFERFVQVDVSDARSLGGTGLGLPISKSLVERHGGQIWAMSEVGRGTTMTFSLPLATGAQKAGRVDAGTVLLVEDDDDLASVITGLLGKDGLAVLRASTTAEAIALGARVSPDIVILDLMLPDGDGDDVVVDFRRRGILPGTPLVIYSALPAPTNPAMSLGEDVYLQKSRHRPHELRAHVLALLAGAMDGHPARPAVETSPITETAPAHDHERRTVSH